MKKCEIYINPFVCVQMVGLLRHTSLGFGEALVQAEDNLLYKVLDVAGLWPSDKHHPVMGEAFCCHFLPQLGSVAQLQLHLHCALKMGRQKQNRQVP